MARHPENSGSKTTNTTQLTPRRPTETLTPFQTKKTSTRRRARIKDAGKAMKKKEKALRVVQRLTQTPRREFTVASLDVDTLRPLVDLAYWSTFLEVRRDAAAAFATLAMNEENLETLSQAGALGALLALIGVNNGKNDSNVQRDAGKALSYLVKLDDVNVRLLQAPDGLNSLFYMCRSPSYEVKRAAIGAITNVAKTNKSKEAIVSAGGISHLFALTSTRDERTKRKATRVLCSLSEHVPVHDKIVFDKSAIRCTTILLLDCPDILVRRDMIQMVTNLASSDARRLELVKSGILGTLELHLDPTHSSLETIILVFRCLQRLSLHKQIQKQIVQDEIVEAIMKIIFVELKEFRNYNMNRKNMRLQKQQVRFKSPSKSKTLARILLDGDHGVLSENYGSQKGKNGKLKDSPTMEDEALRLGLSVLVHLADHADNRDPLIEKGLHRCVLKDVHIYASRDKKIRRPVAKMLALLCDVDVDVKNNNDSQLYERHQKLIHEGILNAVSSFLIGGDYELKISATHITAHISASPVGKQRLSENVGILRDLVNLISPHNNDMNELILKSIGELSDSKANHDSLMQVKVLPALISMIGPKYKKTDVGFQAVRALSNLSNNESIQNKIVKAGALGYIISMSRSGTGLTKMYALALLTNLKHDTAALRIQIVTRGFIARRMVAKRRDLMQNETKTLQK